MCVYENLCVCVLCVGVCFECELQCTLALVCARDAAAPGAPEQC